MPRSIAAFAHHHPAIATAALVLVLLYLTHHGRHYRKRRRHGLSVRASTPGPFGTRLSKRF
jgi:hypothetical protein